MLVTTSWDDGYPLDLRIADLLDQYGLRGTFYVAHDYLPDRLSEVEIRRLARRHEIGAHTLTHPVLTQIDLSAARREITASRDWLQDVIGAPVSAFCYPKGALNPSVRALVAEAGFTVARTVKQYYLLVGDDWLALPSTIKAGPLSARWLLPHIIPLRIPPTACRSWPALAQFFLRRASLIGGVWHLRGHSWEIEKYGLWDDLERVLAAASPYAGAVTNSELISRFRNATANPAPS